MHKLIAVTIVVLLAFNVAASEGGVNEDTDLAETNISVINADNIIYAESDFSISLILKDGEMDNVSGINWITQVCINTGVCYPPNTIEMNTGDNETWNGIVNIDEDATYLNWRIDLIDSNENTTRVPETGFGWKIWSDCWYDGNNWGGNDSSCWPEDEDDSVPGFIVPLTLAAIGTAVLMTRRD
jgi:hypothetical protein|tara:strand:- start:59 stop:610 length:552 start_codon:yes stop_codon:yes gene_type:complete